MRLRCAAVAMDPGAPAARSSAAVGPDLPLPEGWKRLYSRTKGREYYQHIESGKSQWHPPFLGRTGDVPRRAASPLPSSSASSPLTQDASQDETDVEHGHEAATTRARRGAKEEAEGSQEQWKQRAMRAEALVVSLVSCEAPLLLYVTCACVSEHED